MLKVLGFDLKIYISVKHTYNPTLNIEFYIEL